MINANEINHKFLDGNVGRFLRWSDNQGDKIHFLARRGGGYRPTHCLGADFPSLRATGFALVNGERIIYFKRLGKSLAETGALRPAPMSVADFPSLRATGFTIVNDERLIYFRRLGKSL